MATPIRHGAEDTREEQVERWISEATADAVTREAEMEAARPFVKAEAVLRLMTEEKMAATNADKAAATDARYVHHLSLQRDVVAQKLNACTAMHSARLRAELAIAAIRSIAGYA